MFRTARTLVCGIVIGASLVCSAVSAFAQGVAPASNVTGYANQQLRGIYNSGIGTGYTSSGLLQLDLNRARAQVPYAGQSSVTNSPPRIGLGPVGSRTAKPFTSFSPQPTVSPYLNLFRRDLGGNDDLNYNTLVRPQLQQQQVNQQLQRQNFENARKLQAMAAQADYNIAGSKEQVPTGHQTAFQYYGRYYTFPRVPRQ